MLGIEKALKYAQNARHKFYDFAVREKWTQPKLFSHLFILTASELSLRSGFLEKELLEIYEKYKNDKDEDLFFRLNTFWVAKTYLEIEEIKSQIANLLSDISESEKLTDNEKVRFALILGFLDSRNPIPTEINY